MQQLLKIKNIIMKQIFILLIAVTPYFVNAQSITADPALNPMEITLLNNSNIFVTQLPKNAVIKLKVPILNKNTTNPLPAGTCKVKISLGSKIILDPTYNLMLVNTSNYFSWTYSATAGQVLITGDLIADLPANFSDTAYFDVIGVTLGSSTIATNFLVSNHNSAINLSDENSSNNIASTFYTIVNGLLPVSFLNIFAEKKNCSLDVFFDVENEININNYDLELSNNSNNFIKVSSLQANNSNRYTFQNLNIPDEYIVPILLVRIKSVGTDGSIKYSDIKKLSGICDSKLPVLLYPNPMPKNSNSFYIQKNSGLFNGSYTIQIFDLAGKLVQVANIKLANIKRFKYEIAEVLSGQYIIRIIENGNNISNTFKILKQ